MTGTRRSIGTGAAWESRYGYCRAVASGDSAWVAGTTASSEGAAPAPDAAGQARTAFGIALKALAELEFSSADVVRTRIFLTDISDADDVGQVHGEIFAREAAWALGEIGEPVATMVAVSALVDPSLVVEIELEARRVPPS